MLVDPMAPSSRHPLNLPLKSTLNTSPNVAVGRPEVQCTVGSVSSDFAWRATSRMVSMSRGLERDTSKRKSVRPQMIAILGSSRKRLKNGWLVVPTVFVERIDKRTASKTRSSSSSSGSKASEHILHVVTTKVMVIKCSNCWTEVR
jgi:hypothetical protein